MTEVTHHGSTLWATRLSNGLSLYVVPDRNSRGLPPKVGGAVLNFVDQWYVPILNVYGGCASFTVGKVFHSCAYRH